MSGPIVSQRQSCLIISSPGVKPDRPVLFLNLRPVYANNFYSEKMMTPVRKPVSPPAVPRPVNSSTLSFFWKNKLSLLLSAMACPAAPLTEDFLEKKKQAVFADTSPN